ARSRNLAIRARSGSRVEGRGSRVEGRKGERRTACGVRRPAKTVCRFDPQPSTLDPHRRTLQVESRRTPGTSGRSGLRTSAGQASVFKKCSLTGSGEDLVTRPCRHRSTATALADVAAVSTSTLTAVIESFGGEVRTR